VSANSLTYSSGIDLRQFRAGTCRWRHRGSSLDIWRHSNRWRCYTIPSHIQLRNHA